MNLKDVNILFGFTGAICTFPKIIEKFEEISKEGANLYPIMSYNAYYLSKKNKNEKYIEKIEHICNQKIIHTLEDVEKLFKKNNFDIMVIAPLDSNSIAKIANSISDTPITLAVKLHLKNKKSLVLFIYADDGLSTNACNIGTLLNRKHLYFVPFGQNNPITKPYSLSSNTEYIVKTINSALNNEQIQPIIL